MADNFLQGFQVGANTGASIIDRRQRAAEFRYRQESDAEDRELRIQELKSAQALRMVQERAAAQRLAMDLEEHNQMVQQRADMAKASAKFQALSSPVIPVPLGMGRGSTLMANPMQAPNAGVAFIQSFGPLAKTPKEAADIAASGAMLAMKPLADQALIRQRQESADLSALRGEKIQAEIDQIKNPKAANFAPTDIQKRIEFFEGRGIKLTPSQLQKIANVTLGIDPRAGTEESRGDAIMRVFTHLRENRPKADSDGVVLKDARRIVDAIYEENALGENTPSQPQAPTAQPSNLNSDTVPVRSPNGKLGRIPRSQIDDAKRQGYTVFEGGKG